MALRQQTKALNAAEPPAPSPSPWALEAIQQPRRARMCGSGEKADRRPLDPPPIIRLRIRKSAVATTLAAGPRKRKGAAAPAATDDDKFVSPTLTHTLFCFASLVGEHDDEEIYSLSGSRTKHVTGSVVSSLFHLKDQSCFVFPDLSVRTEGRWRFKMSMYEIVEDGVNYCASVFTDVFTVYTSKRFPGMGQSTELSKAFAQQGLRLRIRRPGAKDDDDDEPAPEEKPANTVRRKKAAAPPAAPVRFSGPPPSASPSSTSRDLPGDDGGSTRGGSTIGERSPSPPPDSVHRAASRKRTQSEAALGRSPPLPPEELRRILPPMWSSNGPVPSVRGRRVSSVPVPHDPRYHGRSGGQLSPPAPQYRSSFSSQPSPQQTVDPRYGHAPRYPLYSDAPPPARQVAPPPPRFTNAPPVFHYYQPPNVASNSQYSAPRPIPPAQPPNCGPGHIPSVLAPIHTHTREFSTSSNQSASSSYRYDNSRPTTAGTTPGPVTYRAASALSTDSRSPEETAAWDRERQRYQSQHRSMGSEAYYGQPAAPTTEEKTRSSAASSLQPMEGVERESRHAAVAEPSGGPSSLNKLLGDGAKDAKEVVDTDEPFFF